MEHIIASRNKYIKTDLQLKESVQSEMKLIDRVKNKQDQQFSENQTKIEELTSKITSMNEVLQSEKQILEYKKCELSKHLENEKVLEAERNKFLEGIHVLELQRKKFRHCKPNAQDQELLERGRRKYVLYKELTRIRWDYEALKEGVKGYVTNKTDYIHHFSYKNENPRDLSDSLWQEIYKSTIPTHRPDDKENIVQN